MKLKIKIITITILILIIVSFSNIFYYNLVINNNSSDNSNNHLLNRELKEGEEEEGFNIFLVPHSHCDHGWLRTYDEYYYGTVKYIISGFINELKNDIEKKFVWAEIGFFSRWYESANQDTKNTVKQLIKNGQLEFTTGGWVQNDEACADLDDIIEQMTQGHQWLKDNLNYTVEYAWQIDPFGYSSITPSTYSQMGLKGLVLNRIAYNVKDYMKDNLEMEFVWKGSDTLGKKSEMIVSTLDRHYDYFPKLIDPRRNATVEERVSSFVDYLKKVSKTRNSKNLLFLLGDDFRYSNAKREFQYSKEWITYIQERKDQFKFIKQIKYSTVSEYFNQLKQDVLNDKLKLTQIDKDFFPYATAIDEYWTGYYVTRPSIKKQIREFSKLLRNTDSIYTLLNLNNNFTTLSLPSSSQISNDIKNSRNLLSLTQHHDIVTGTSRSYVLLDYFNQLKNQRLINLNLISNFLNLFNNNNYQQILNKKEELNNSNNNNQNEIINNNNEEFYLYNNFINLNQLNNNEYYSIKLFNSLGWNYQRHYSFKIQSNDSIKLEKLKLFDSNLNEIKNIQINSISYQNQCFQDMNQYLLFTIINIPALGFTTYYIKIDMESNDQVNQIYNGQKFKRLKSEIIFNTKDYQYELSKENGFLKSVKNLSSNEKEKIGQEFKQYKAKKSGPYIFEAGKLENTLNNPDYYLLFEGPLVSQLSIIYKSNQCNKLSIINQRVYRSIDNSTTTSRLISEKYLETSYSIIGEMNRERVIRYKINSIKENKEIFTDNGLESRKRIFNKFGSTTSNYYPTLHYVNLKNSKSNQQYTVYVDRSVGITLHSENSIEIMIHRTMERDDWKGVGWPSIDTSRIDGKLYFNIESIQYQKDYEKFTSLNIDHQPIHLIKKISNINQHLQSDSIQHYSSLIKPLPSFIHLLSFKILNSNNGNFIGLRLINLGNDNYNTKNQLSLNNYFKFFNNISDIGNNGIKETGLTFLDMVDDSSNDLLIKENFKINNNFIVKSGKSEYNFTKYQLNQKRKLEQQNEKNIIITINPLEIKSYLINIPESSILNNNDNNNNLDNSIYNKLKFNSNSNNSEIYKDVLNSIYIYDFSVYPLEISNYNDIGHEPDRHPYFTMFKKLIIPGIIALSVLITIIIIAVFIKKRRNNNIQFKKLINQDHLL